MAGSGRKVWTRERLTTDDINGYLMDQTVMQFASASARDAAIPLAARKVGMQVWRDELGGVIEAWTGSAWKIIDMAFPPFLRGTLLRSDDSATVNGPNTFTDLKCVLASGDTVNTWTAYNGVRGYASAVPGAYDIAAYLPTDINEARSEEMLLEGTLAATLGGSSSGGPPATKFGGSGGSITVRAPAGLQFSFRYANYAPNLAGTIRTGSRFHARWAGPL